MLASNWSTDPAAVEGWKYLLLKKWKRIGSFVVVWMDVEGEVDLSEQLQNRNM